MSERENCFHIKKKQEKKKVFSFVVVELFIDILVFVNNILNKYDKSGFKYPYNITICFLYYGIKQTFFSI